MQCAVCCVLSRNATVAASVVTLRFAPVLLFCTHAHTRTHTAPVNFRLRTAMIALIFFLSQSQKTCFGGQETRAISARCLIGICRQCTSLRMINGRTRLSAPPRMNSLRGSTTEGTRSNQIVCLSQNSSSGRSFGVSAVAAVGGARNGRSAYTSV